MKKILFIYILFFTSISVIYSQTVEEIKKDRNTYLWGEGIGATLKKADSEALEMLISQISTRVESNFELLKEEVVENDKENFKETLHSVINTYSEATLKNTDRIVLSNEPEARVFRYINRSDILKVFEQRRDKIIGFVENADRCISEDKIADGLRYYYWSLILLKSHPYGGKINYESSNGENHLLATWLPFIINDVFSNISISVSDIEESENIKTLILDIRYKDNQIENFDYSYWDGGDWSNIISARNGMGLVELFGVSKDSKTLKLKAEYIFEGESRIDRELENVLSEIDPIPFKKSYFTISTSKSEREEKQKSKRDLTTIVGNDKEYNNSILEILNNINNKNYTTVENKFTEEGYLIFEKLIKYGNAKVLPYKKLNFIKYEDKVICRSVPMNFSFKTNNKQFIENVVFQFNEGGKVDNISFELSKTALEDIVSKDIWSEFDRITLISFLENYKTAYALERIDYIDQIFADDALIITGSIIKIKPVEDNYSSNRIVEYNRQSKEKYIRKLRYLFNSKEFVNIKFERSRIRKAGKGGNIYGIQIKQNYVSSNYGDEGYLFLMVDMNTPTKPIIHVRTWQPKIDENDHVYGLSDFN